MHPHHRFRNSGEKSKSSPQIRVPSYAPTSSHTPRLRTSKRFDASRLMEKKAEQAPLVMPPAVKKNQLSAHDMKVFVQENLMRLIRIIKQWMAQ